MRSYKSEARRRRDRIDLLRLMLIEALGGHCVKCGLADLDDLEIDHVDGITWDRYAVGRAQRIRRYVSEYRDGVRLQLLCGTCHPRGQSSAAAWGAFREHFAVPTQSPLAVRRTGPIKATFALKLNARVAKLVDAADLKPAISRGKPLRRPHTIPTTAKVR